MENDNETTNVTNAETKSNFFTKSVNAVKGFFGKCGDWFKEITKNVNWKVVWDKFTTGLLIFLMCSPILILGYIFLWFVLKSY